MEVTIRQEAGYDLALYGFSLSYKDRSVPPDDWWDFSSFWNQAQKDFYCEVNKEDGELTQVQKYIRTKKTATALAGKGKGHDKWLRQVILFVDIEAPRYFWSEFDTYKVGTVAQSESTMHTLSRRRITHMDLEGSSTPLEMVEYIADNMEGKSIQEMKQLVPESYLQRRLVTMNYAVLRCIIEQRKNHRLPEWATFIKAIYDQVEHPELLPA